MKFQNFSCKRNPQWIILLSTLALLSPAAQAESWDGRNNPGNLLGRQYETSLHALPAAMTLPVDSIPYSDTYWPQNRGGIAYRWNSTQPYLLTGERFDDRNVLHRDGQRRYVTGWTNPHLIVDASVLNYRKYTLTELRGMTRAQLSELSPAEKFDIIRGRCTGCRNNGWFRGDYPLTREVLANSNTHHAYWAGSCHGWAPASVHHAEPQPVDVSSPDGLVIPFGSGDVKGLLNYFYGYRNRRSSYLGGICRTDLERNPGAAQNSECVDVNAGAFHIVLANTLGVRRQGLLADTERGMEVWNYPIYEYQSHLDRTPSPEAQQLLANSHRARGAVRSQYVETDISFSDDNEDYGPDWWPVVGTACFKKDSAHYKYWLDLDAYGRIVGGTWVTTERPDNLWSKNRYEFTGDFAELAFVYREMTPALRARYQAENPEFYQRCASPTEGSEAEPTSSSTPAEASVNSDSGVR